MIQVQPDDPRGYDDTVYVYVKGVGDGLDGQNVKISLGESVTCGRSRHCEWSLKRTPLYLKNQTLYGVFLTRERQRLIELARIADRGQLKPVVAETLPLEQVHKAHQRLDTGHGAGKVILRVA